MTGKRIERLFQAGAIVRALAIDLVDPNLRKTLVGLSFAIDRDTSKESDKGIALTRTDIGNLRDSLAARNTMAGIIMSEALDAVVTLTRP